MNKEKDTFAGLVLFIADETNLEQTAVRQIITTFLDLCREDLLNGRVVRFVGLVTLVPNPVLTNHVKTSAMYCKQTAEVTRYSYYVVQGVVQKYLEKLKVRLQDGWSVSLRKLCTIDPLWFTTGERTIHSTTSDTIGEELLRRGGVVQSVRAHTCRYLKRSIKTMSVKVEAVVG